MAGAKEDDANEQLSDVCVSLSGRLTAGIERTLRELRIAEDKEMLANEAYSLLRHTLAGTIHVPAVSALDGDMRTLATRPVSREGHVSVSNGTSSYDEKVDDGFVALERLNISQTLDEAREYVSIIVSGVVADQVLSDTSRKAQRLRLDIYVCAAACMSWEIIWTTVVKIGDRVSVIARTPWRDVMTYVAAGQGELRLQLRLLLADGRVQKIGELSMLTPAILLQQQAIGKSTNNAHQLWPQNQVTLIVNDAQQQSCDNSIYNTSVCGASTTIRRAGRMCRIDIKAPDDLSLAAYAAALKQSVPDSAGLRLHAVQRERVEELKMWARSLRAETAAFRTTGAKCARGFEKDDIQKLFRKQIALDETLGKCKESD